MENRFKLSSSQKKLTAFQKKLIEAFEQSEFSAEQIKKFEPFDFYCINDFCGARNGKRNIGVAWRNANGLYGSFCGGCGEENKLTKQEMREHKLRIDKEMARDNMETQNSTKKDTPNKEPDAP